MSTDAWTLWTASDTILMVEICKLQRTGWQWQICISLAIQLGCKVSSELSFFLYSCWFQTWSDCWCWSYCRMDLCVTIGTQTHYAVQDRSRSPILVPCYGWLLVKFLLVRGKCLT